MSLEVAEIPVLAIFRNRPLKRLTCLQVPGTQANPTEDSLGRHVLTSVAAELCLISPQNYDGGSKLTTDGFYICCLPSAS